jgi:hypothetical protein
MEAVEGVRGVVSNKFKVEGATANLFSPRAILV